MSVANVSVARFEMGRTASRTFGVIRHNLITFVALSVAVGIPLALLGVGPVLFPGFPRTSFFVPSALLFYAIVGLAYGVGIFLVQAAVVQGAVLTLSGRRASLSDCVSTGVSVFFPVFLLTIVMTFGVAAGLLLLIVPGVIFIIMWSVAVPVRVVEKTTALGALGRSRELTRGHRWAIFGLLTAFTILEITISAIGGALTGAGLGASRALTAPGISITHDAVSIALSMVNSIIGTALVASIYYELRVIKEGVGPETLAAVFD